MALCPGHHKQLRQRCICLPQKHLDDSVHYDRAWTLYDTIFDAVGVDLLASTKDNQKELFCSLPYFEFSENDAISSCPKGK